MHTERRPCEDAETERTGEDPWKAEAETEAMRPQAKERQGVPAKPRKRERFFPESLRREPGPADTSISDFRSPEL